MSLLEKIKQAVGSGDLPVWFTTAHLKKWVVRKNIINDATGQFYADATIESQLSTCLVGSTSTRSDKGLQSRIVNGITEYSFIQ